MKRPTKSELEILSVLWDKGQSTVREVFDALGSEDRGGYTTVLKLMQIMHEKGLVKRDESSRAHIYSPGIERDEVATSLLGDVVEKVFGGSASRLVQQLLDAEQTSPEEIAEIKELIRKSEAKEKS